LNQEFFLRVHDEIDQMMDDKMHHLFFVLNQQALSSHRDVLINDPEDKGKK
jgi:hypothetical protein